MPKKNKKTSKKGKRAEAKLSKKAGKKGSKTSDKGKAGANADVIDPAAIAAQQELPTKDKAAFQHLVTLYDSGRYKKGIKTADGILKKHPTHGETMSMKALCVYNLDKNREALEKALAMVKTSVMYNMKSHIDPCRISRISSKKKCSA